MEEIIRTEYSELMQKAYIDYAMSVIVSRALPDVRDGLKPVQRRTLYDMLELGTYWDRPYRKSARIVGDTMGKYHPHGDSSIYDALVVMAQDFKKGQPLVDGHGNFGSIEGDGAAAMRYTEARLMKITQEVYLQDLDKDVVNWVPNFDETEKEPEVLPVRIPNLLVNGSDGIAVGMATSIPPHNLGEVADAARAYIRNSSLTSRQLMKYIKGPDFPTGGIVVNMDELPEIYETGTGKIRIRGKVEVEQGKNGKQYLVITEIPYPMIGANIGKFLCDVAELVESRQAPEITDISNQSSKEGIRIVLELRRGADVERLKNLLYRKTRLEDTFGVNMLAVVNGRPETLGLKQILDQFVDFQFDITTRKYQRLLAKEMEKEEIQEGLIRAVDVIDLIIEILRGSRNQQQAKDCLTMGVTDGIRFRHKTSEKQAKELCFTNRQAQAILDMRLVKLIGLELDALYKENEETKKKIDLYENILNNYDAMADVILKDLEHTKKEFARPRRTQLMNAQTAEPEEPEEEDAELVFLMDRFGYARTVEPSVYERNQEAADKENKYVFRCMSSGKICIFTDRGTMHTVRVKDLPFGKFRDKGTPVDNLCNYSSAEEEIVSVTPLADILDKKLVFVTSAGMVKVVDGGEFNASKRTISATRLSVEEDRLVMASPADQGEFLVMQTVDGYFIRFAVSEIPEKKKTAVGVRGIRLGADDRVEKAWLIASRMEFAVSYKEKKLILNKIRLSKRDGKGTKVRV
ncbi:DNA gyrase/topoisomerase IV subunit A [Bilifractor porci]|uniref:DNA topoisomerase (ATP-hydrolyzing) n=1 Tax=Bilifractor porci TaxID=2606636 RepID=A0A7X2P7B9_9FIRM|nr:DNA topoisomerase (ATP-hydrolyzing) [Bilifractor porci]MST81058.1 DNA topoisomerase 4 subunit A [Bilifractor porci]